MLPPPRNTKRVHIVIKVPHNRPPDAPLDPTPVDWSLEKEQYLWNALSRSRSAESAGIDWPTLAVQLNTPLPYLLFRAQARYEEDLRGLQGFKGPLHLSNTQRHDDGQLNPEGERPSSAFQRGVRTPWSTPNKTSALPTPRRLPTPLAGASKSNTTKDTTPPVKTVRDLPLSESTSTISHQPPLATRLRAALTNHDSSPSQSSSSSDEDEGEETDGKADDERIGQRLKDLEKMMASNMLGFARQPQSPRGKPASPRTPSFAQVKGRPNTSASPATPSPRGRHLMEGISPQSSVPSIPSPSQSRSPADVPPQVLVGKSPESSLNTPLIRGRMPLRATSGLGRTRTGESNHGSSASSFSDISDTSISASALEDALMSNIGKGATSRISTFARSQLAGPRGSSRQ